MVAKACWAREVRERPIMSNVLATLDALISITPQQEQQQQKSNQGSV